MLERVTEEIIDDIRTQLSEVRTIVKEDHGARRVTFHVGPRMDVSTKRVLDREHEIIKKYCNSPYLMYSDVTSYRFTLACN